MLSGDTNISFRCIIWSKEIFFRQSNTYPFLNKRRIRLWKSVKEVSPQITISGSKKSGVERFLHTIHTKTTNSRRNKKWIKYTFTPTVRGIIKSANEILCESLNDVRLYQLIKWYSFPSSRWKIQSLFCLVLITYNNCSLVMRYVACYI